ncbi:hypothetical protein Tdes44962_MAKER02986 [Teratosphaeria destructans]|uniref:Uncharacterized protein n=1 Tax=Teratosphaeria destructans TaxID=418781 RepID=A0A9W7SRG6_9PEZI|nr:hypothetical protein Tdes44962_MAKER02986 [Teratosphaeria destructans]
MNNNDNNHHHPRPQPSSSSSSTTATRPPRTHPTLLAPPHPRRPPNLLDDEIHTDPTHTSDEDPVPTTTTTTRRLRKPRTRPPEKADPDFVTRQPDGGYLLGTSAQDALTSIMFAPEIMEAQAEKGIYTPLLPSLPTHALTGNNSTDVDAEYAETCRGYFTSGAALKATRRQEEGEFRLFFFFLLYWLVVVPWLRFLGWGGAWS